MKHAYLILAHNDIYILKSLISALDDEDNDFFIHMDIKYKESFIDELKKCVNRSNLFFTKRISVAWGNYSMVKAEMILLKAAVSHGQYDYYHLLSGHDFPIKSKEYIYRFFEENKGYEFISYNRPTLKESNENNYKYFYFSNTRFNSLILSIQRTIGINRIKNSGFVYMKGSQWFDITHSCACYVLANEGTVKKLFRFSKTPDEVFLHTIVYNSDFKNHIYMKDMNDIMYRELKANRLMGNVRLVDWPDYLECPHPRIFSKLDFDDLIRNPNLFARKFDSTVDKTIIDFLMCYLKSTSTL